MCAAGENIHVWRKGEEERERQREGVRERTRAGENIHNTVKGHFYMSKCLKSNCVMKHNTTKYWHKDGIAEI